MFSPSNKNWQTKGFTIFELMVSVTIMVIISTMIAGNQSTYSSGAALKNIANDLALSLRQAQIYGISVREFSPGSNTFNVGYGVSFNTNSVPNGDTGSYVFFADRDKDGNYDNDSACAALPGTECLDKVVFGSGNYLSDLCTLDLNNNNVCNTGQLDITFVRPAIEARIIMNGTQNNRGACIEISSKDGKVNSVLVYNTGQVSVRDNPC
jgi:prepilin-type N-terminal cleavage/methylation domain-containing protein